MILTEVEALRRLQAFSGIEPGKLKLVAMSGDLVQFEPNEAIFRRADPPDAAYITLDGAVRVVVDRDDMTVIVSRHRGPILLGEVGILLGHPRNVTIVAETPVPALRLAANDFLQLVRTMPDIAFAVMRELARQIEVGNNQFAERLFAGESAPHPGAQIRG